MKSCRISSAWDLGLGSTGSSSKSDLFYWQIASGESLLSIHRKFAESTGGVGETVSTMAQSVVLAWAQKFTFLARMEIAMPVILVMKRQTGRTLSLLGFWLCQVSDCRVQWETPISWQFCHPWLKRARELPAAGKLSIFTTCVKVSSWAPRVLLSLMNSRYCFASLRVVWLAAHDTEWKTTFMGHFTFCALIKQFSVFFNKKKFHERIFFSPQHWTLREIYFSILGIDSVRFRPAWST